VSDTEEKVEDINFKTAYDSVRREILYDILIQFGEPMKVIAVVKVYLNEPPIQWVPGTLSLGVKRPRESDHSPPCSAEVNNAYSYTSTPPIRSYDVVLS
jgi:hypothetical protein